MFIRVSRSFLCAHLAILDLLSGQLDHSADFGGDAEILEEPLVSRPELAPHGLLHALLRINQVCSLLELLACTHPLGEVVTSGCCKNPKQENKTCASNSFSQSFCAYQLHRFVVHVDVFLRKGNFLDFEGYTCETQLPCNVHSS